MQIFIKIFDYAQLRFTVCHCGICTDGKMVTIVKQINIAVISHSCVCVTRAANIYLLNKSLWHSRALLRLHFSPLDLCIPHRCLSLSFDLRLPLFPSSLHLPCHSHCFILSIYLTFVFKIPAISGNKILFFILCLAYSLTTLTSKFIHVVANGKICLFFFFTATKCFVCACVSSHGACFAVSLSVHPSETLWTLFPHLGR